MLITYSGTDMSSILIHHYKLFSMIVTRVCVCGGISKCQDTALFTANICSNGLIIFVSGAFRCGWTLASLFFWPIFDVRLKEMCLCVCLSTGYMTSIFRNFHFHAFYWHFSIFSPNIIVVDFSFQGSGHSFSPRDGDIWGERTLSH